MALPDAEQARAIALRIVRELSGPDQKPFELMPERTQSLDDGWVFFYQSAEFVRTGDPLSALAGNCPIFVMRDGTVHLLPTYWTWERGVESVRRGG
ncbi:YrhB family protein [Tahibacter soli]|uniref:YrhB family protein n=1 Tax=Tahibacter soli TaxID=2983605 RepID=A0A9X3YJ09_9GAMM|nr:YrhB family protein [Tahibacter soli]MDC8012085.1 YrhB family protein [Tahibacter soli]